MHPVCFKATVDHPNERKTSRPDDVPEPPLVDAENQANLGSLVVAFGLEKKILGTWPPFEKLNNTILTKQQELDSLYYFFVSKVNMDGGLKLLDWVPRDKLIAKKFYEMCEDRGSIVTVVKPAEGYICGSFYISRGVATAVLSLGVALPRCAISGKGEAETKLESAEIASDISIGLNGIPRNLVHKDR